MLGARGNLVRRSGIREALCREEVLGWSGVNTAGEAYFHFVYLCRLKLPAVCGESEARIPRDL